MKPMIDLVSVIPAKTRRDTKWKMAYQVEILELENIGNLLCRCEAPNGFRQQEQH